MLHSWFDYTEGLDVQVFMLFNGKTIMHSEVSSLWSVCIASIHSNCSLISFPPVTVRSPNQFTDLDLPIAENYMCADKAWNSIHSVETQAKIEIIQSLAPQGKKATVHCTLFVYTFCMLPSSQQKKMYIGCLLGFTGWQSSRWACHDYYKIDVGGNK